jgi:hypothetical protein
MAWAGLVQKKEVTREYVPWHRTVRWTVFLEIIAAGRDVVRLDLQIPETMAVREQQTSLTKSRPPTPSQHGDGRPWNAASIPVLRSPDFRRQGGSRRPASCFQGTALLRCEHLQTAQRSRG